MSTTTPTTTVAVLGTGAMGLPMAANIAGAGLHVRAWNRTRSKAEPLRASGADICDTPADAVMGADVVLTMLYDADAVAAAMGGAGDPGGPSDTAGSGSAGALGSMTPGAVWVQASTVGVDGCNRLAALASAAGVAFVDAPVLGSRKPAEDGTLAVLASGPEEVRTRCQPVLDAVGSSVRWLGPAGAGSRLKLVVNNWVLTVTEAVAESVALAEALGVDPTDYLEALRGSQIDCAYAHLKGGAMIARSFEPSFTLDAAAKDARLILDAAADAGLQLNVTRAVHQDLSRAAELGHGGRDMAATYLGH